MQSDFDVRQYLKIDKRRPVELRICHIAELWYGAVLSGRMKNQLDTIYNLFPDLVIVEGDRTGKAGDHLPEYDFTTKYITAYRKGGYLLQGAGDVVPPIINCLYGSVTSPKQSGPANDIQKRTSGELCRDISLISGLRSHYTRLILGLSPRQLDDFKIAFEKYINTVADDLEKFPDYKTPLFPFSSERRVLDLNNYLSKEFEAGNYADFFLWMNLGALLRDEIKGLIDTYDSSFELRTAPSTEGGAKRGIPKCLTKIPPVSQTVGLVGREDVKAAVRSMLEEGGRMALVSGLGGIGKTAVMQYVCNDLKEEGKYVAWIDCGDSLKRDLLSLGAALGIDTGDPDSAYEQVLLAVKTRLDGALYLFLDDLTEDLTREELGDLNSLEAHIMATSRKACDAFPTVGLEVLSDDSAVTMFFRYYNGDTDRRYEAAARRIVSSVGRHTLLVELLARAAKRSGGTLEDFNTRLEAEGVYDVFRRKIDTAHDEKMTIEDCVIRLYETSSLSDAQKHIMRLFSIFTPGKEIYYKVSEWAGLDMDAMDELIDLGWIETSGQENNYKIHQIIRDSMTLQMRRQGNGLRIEDYGRLLDEVSNTHSYMPQDLEYTKVRERLVLAEDVAEYLKARTEEVLFKEESLGEQKTFFTSVASLFHNLAMVCSDRGDYGKALEYYGKALAIRERVLGFEHPDTATTYDNMARVYREMADYGKALEYYGKALAIRERVLGFEHPDTATTYDNMARVYREMADYGKALEYYGKALAIRERVLGFEHPDTATTYNSMACVYTVQRDDVRALEYFEKAMLIRERVLGPEHPDTAGTYNDMSVMYCHLGNHERGLELRGKAMAIYECVYGSEHPSTATVYNNMADMYYCSGDYQRALEYAQKALNIREHVFGPEHPTTEASYHEMAKIYHEMGDFRKAQEYFGKSLAICERVIGPKHPSTAITYCNIASFLYSCDHEKALEYYEKAVSIFEQVLGPEHPNTVKTYYCIAGVYRTMGDYGKALEYFGKALAIRERMLGPEHQATIATYYDMVWTYRYMDDYEKALEYLGKILEIRKHVLGPEHPDTVKTYDDMAGVCRWNRDYGKALEYFGKALAIRERMLGPEHHATIATYYDMVWTYCYMRDYVKALEYLGKILEIRKHVLGPEHPDTVETYDDIAGVYRWMRDYGKALEYYGKVLTIRERVLGSNHLDTKLTMQAITKIKSFL